MDPREKNVKGRKSKQKKKKWGVLLDLHVRRKKVILMSDSLPITRTEISKEEKVEFVGVVCFRRCKKERDGKRLLLLSMG